MSRAALNVDATRSEAWLTVAITSGIVAVLSIVTLGAWAWWIDATGWLDRCVVGDGSDANYGELVWTTMPPGPRCVWTEQANGFDATSPVNWSWSVLVGVAVVSTVIACCGTARHV